jgi:nucleoside-diphosphate-sugar epimerase
MAEQHLVTGATGFVGGALVLELLRETDVRVVCVTRPHGDPAAAGARLETALASAANAFQVPELLPAIRARCRAVPGDVRLPLCGVDPAAVGPVSEVWHCAASLRFEAARADEVNEHNVEGTRRMLALGWELGARTFNYMSTAYVAGRRSGRILEVLPEGEPPTSNLYEASKVRAEQLVARGPLPWRILRPSIVIGHSKTCASSSASGFYGYIRRLVGFRRALAKRGESHVMDALELYADPGAPLNLIPVDAVAANALRIAQSGSRQRVFHLTNASPPTVGTAAAVIGELLGTRGPRLALDASPDAPYAKLLSHQMEFFLSYLVHPKKFDRSHTDAALGRAASEWPLDQESLARYVRSFLEELGDPAHAGD